jgi:hypothetical protein
LLFQNHFHTITILKLSTRRPYSKTKLALVHWEYTVTIAKEEAELPVLHADNEWPWNNARLVTCTAICNNIPFSTKLRSETCIGIKICM